MHYTSIHDSYVYTPPPPPPPPSLLYNHGVSTYAHVLCHLNPPYLGGKDRPPYLWVMHSYHWQLQKKTPPFPGFLWKSSRDCANKYLSFLRKWEHRMRPPLCIQMGGGGVGWGTHGLFRITISSMINDYPEIFIWISNFALVWKPIISWTVQTFCIYIKLGLNSS